MDNALFGVPQKIKKVCHRTSLSAYIQAVKLVARTEAYSSALRFRAFREGGGMYQGLGGGFYVKFGRNRSFSVMTDWNTPRYFVPASPLVVMSVRCTAFLVPVL